MHVSSKKDLSSGELEILKRSRTSITVVTASGERRMQKRKFMCMIFIFSLPLLEGTPAVMSLGKLVKEHGYTHESVVVSHF